MIKSSANYLLVMIIIPIFCFYFCGVAGLSCYHCIHMEGNGTAVEEGSDEYGIPEAPSCQHHPNATLRTDCDSLIGEYIKSVKDNSTSRGLKQIVGIVGGAAEGIENQTWGALERRMSNELRPRVRFTCAKFHFDGNFTGNGNGRRMETTIRTCIPTLRNVPFKESCVQGRLQDVGGRVGDPEIKNFLEVFQTAFYDGETSTLSRTCNTDNCNADKDKGPDSCKRSVSGSGSGSNLAPTTVGLAAALLIPLLSNLY